jgi:hypothetical protein
MCKDKQFFNIRYDNKNSFYNEKLGFYRKNKDYFLNIK